MLKNSLHVYKLCCFSCARILVTLWTVAHQSPLSMGFSRQEYWSGLPCPPPGESSRPRDQTLQLLVLQVDTLPQSHQGNPEKQLIQHKILKGG